MHKVWIDCDPGHDDIMAILKALVHPEEIKIVGISTVCGNQTLDKVTKNLHHVLDFLNVCIPIYPGASNPLDFEPKPQPQAHGESGLDGPVFPQEKSHQDTQNGIEALHKALQKENLTIVALGPLTNLAILFNLYPNDIKYIKKIYMMGGSRNSGNILPRSEFNTYADALAAKIVFSKPLPIVVCDLEICNECAISHQAFALLNQKGNVAQMIYAILDFFSQYSKKRNDTKSPLFDMTVIDVILHPNLFTYQSCSCLIEVRGEYTKGMTIFIKEKGNVTLVEHCKDQNQIENDFLQDMKEVIRKYEKYKNLS